jgi:hypothetical protein
VKKFHKYLWFRDDFVNAYTTRLNKQLDDLAYFLDLEVTQQNVDSFYKFISGVLIRPCRLAEKDLKIEKKNRKLINGKIHNSEEFREIHEQMQWWNVEKLKNPNSNIVLDSTKKN